jgi:hypothetical protein
MSTVPALPEPICPGFSLIGIPAEIMVGSGRKGNDLTGGGPWREVVYKVAWAQSDQFADALLGINVSGGVGGPVQYPQMHRFPGNERLFCHSVTIQGYSGGPRLDSQKLFAFDYAEVTAMYKASTWDAFNNDRDNSFGGQSQPWCRDEIHGYSHNYRLPGKVIVDKATGQNVTTSFPVLVPHVELNRTRFMVPYLYDDLMISTVGKLNIQPLWDLDTGTVRFDSFNTSKQLDEAGNTVQEISLRLVWRSYDWNKQLSDSADGIAWNPVGDLAGNTPYLYTDLSPLFEI